VIFILNVTKATKQLHRVYPVVRIYTDIAVPDISWRCATSAGSVDADKIIQILVNRPLLFANIFRIPI
jgi:hypothetical protein